MRAPMAGLFTYIPKDVLFLLKEAGRHILRRPVVGVACAARTPDGKWVLIRRGDTGTWGLPGGTLEWGETLQTALSRELEEEAGIVEHSEPVVCGVYSDPDRDPRFHAVTVVVRCDVAPPSKGPVNALEILEIRAFAEDELPADLALRQKDMFDQARTGKATGATLE